MVYPADDMPIRLRLLTKEVNRLREKLGGEVERAKAACEAARARAEARAKAEVAGGGGRSAARVISAPRRPCGFVHRRAVPG